YIFNQPYSKEEYLKMVNQWDLGSYETYQKVRQAALEHFKKLPPRPTLDDFSVNYTGNYVFQSKNCQECYEVADAQDCKYLLLVNSQVRDCYDISSWGYNLSLSYEGSVIGDQSSMVRFT